VGAAVALPGVAREDTSGNHRLVHGDARPGVPGGGGAMRLVGAVRDPEAGPTP
jgi:hypothetical protein